MFRQRAAVRFGELSKYCLPRLESTLSLSLLEHRISLWEWSAVAVVHFITLYVTAFFVLRVSPDWIASRALAPVLGDGASVDGASVDGNRGGGVRESPWIVVRSFCDASAVGSVPPPCIALKSQGRCLMENDPPPRSGFGFCPLPLPLSLSSANLCVRRTCFCRSC